MELIYVYIFGRPVNDMYRLETLEPNFCTDSEIKPQLRCNNYPNWFRSYLWNTIPLKFLKLTKKNLPSQFNDNSYLLQKQITLSARIILH